jgi:phage terminase large subunit-like protein
MPFSRDLANKAVRFFETHLRHTKGRWDGVPFKLLDWQRDIIEKLFGTVREDGTRQYRTAYVEVPKKNGKSEIAAGIALKLLFADNEPGAEVYSAAGDRDQASIVFNVARDMVAKSPALSRRSKTIDSTKRIVHNNGSFYRAISAEAYTKHGFNVHGVVFDEVHTQPNRELWDTMTLGTGAARTQPLVFAITTAGYDRHSICWELHDYARKVRDGVIDDPTFLPVLYYADDEDDWTSDEVWTKANPSMGVTMTIEDMRNECIRAQDSAALENKFRRLRLNQWVKQESRFIPMSRWDSAPDRPPLEFFSGAQFYCGLDLASTTDIAAFVAVHVDDEGYFNVYPQFWIPQDTIDKRVQTDRVPYDQWVRDGFIEATPGDWIDHATIKHRIVEFAERHQLNELAYDRWGATEIAQNLMEDGLTIIPFGQGFASMSPPTKELLRVILEGKLRHGGNPVLRWMADNMVVRQDPAGNLKPDKGKSTERIDGIVALVMALDRAIRHEGDGRSVYESKELFVL